MDGCWQDWLALFRQFDRDNDGFIPMQELKDRCHCLSDATEESEA